MISKSFHWRSCALMGLLVIILALYLMPKFPQEAATEIAAYGSPVYAFEMARSVDDLIAVFGDVNDPNRLDRITAMNDGNYWDFPFMVAYGAFIASFFFAAYRSSNKRHWLVFSILGVVAAFSDAYENILLLGLTADLEQALGLHLLLYPVTVKFQLLSICGIGLGMFLLSQDSRIWFYLGILAILAGLASLLAFHFGADVGFFFFVGQGITVCWLIQLVFAVYKGNKERRGA